MHLINPAGPVNPEGMRRALAAFEALDVEVTFDASTLYARTGYLAGRDDERADRMLSGIAANPRGLWMARGGYGSIRTLEHAAERLDRLDDAPPLWGFSDGTALLAEWCRRGWPAWHAPPATQLPRLDEVSRARVRAAVHADHVAPFQHLIPCAAGVATAPLAGGNLCILASLVGTRWAPDLGGTIVVLEDTGEPAYRVDRMVTQLRLSGGLDHIRGLVLGEFTAVPQDQRDKIDVFFDRLAGDLGVPVARGLPIGHDVQNAPLPFGRGAGWRATLEVTDASARLAFDRR